MKNKNDRSYSDRFQFDMYLRNNEIREIYELLEDVRGRTVAQKVSFVKEQGVFLDELSTEILDKVHSDLKEISFDPQSLKLVIEYTGCVRDTFNLLRELKSFNGKKVKKVLN